jgi:hypothetical protein
MAENNSENANIGDIKFSNIFIAKSLRSKLV